MLRNPEEDRPARPWDILVAKVGRVSQEVADQRYSVCKGCEYLVPKVSMCKKCGCLMKIKTTLPHASCPLNKWLIAEQEDVW